MSAISGWDTRSFSDLLKLIRNGYAGQQVADTTDFPVSRIETIADACIDFEKVGYVRSIPLSYLLHEGDMLFSNINSVKHIGKIAQVKRGTRLYHGMNLLVMRLIDEVDENFIFYKLNSKKTWFEQMSAQAVNQASINQATIKELELELPTSKPEQTKIAEILSTVDRAIEQTEALIAKQQRLKTGLMQDLLTRGIDEHGNLRSEQTHPFKDSPLGRIPAEWEVKKLGSLLSSINQGWSPDCESDPAAQGEWGVLRTTAVVWEGYQDHENKGLPPMLAPRPHLEIQAGDLLMTRAGPNSRVGVIAYVYSTRNKLMLSDKIYRLVPTKEADGRFLCFALSSSGSQRHLSNLKTGMAESQTNISQEIVKALMTVCPPSAEQSLIADRLDHISSESNKSTTVLAKLRALKTALMQDLLTGRKRVTDLLVGKERPQ